MSLVRRSDEEISALEHEAEQALLSAESSFTDKTYHQGVLDALQYLLGRDDNPYEREE